MGLRYEMTSNRSYFYEEAEGNQKKPIVEPSSHPQCEHSQRQNMSIKEIGQNSAIHKVNTSTQQSRLFRK